MTKKTKRRRAQKRRHDFFSQNKPLIAIMCLAVFVVLALVLLARNQENTEQLPLQAISKPKVDNPRLIHNELEALFHIMGIAPVNIHREINQIPAFYLVEADLPNIDLIEALEDRLKGLPGDYSVEFDGDSTVTIERSQETLIFVQFKTPPELPPDGPLITIIMDDLGRSQRIAETLVSFPEKVTFAILPEESFAVDVAEIAHAFGHEILLHVPMEPQGYPAVNPGSQALFVEQSNIEIRRRFDLLLSKIPYVSGTNNHMGSRFTEDAEALSPVMESLKEKDLFFIDSLTTGKSRVSEVAHKFGVPSMSRDLFLDNVAEVDAIQREITRLVDKALRDGMAIGICHPYPETIEALRLALPKISRSGITVVPAAVLLQKKALKVERSRLP